MKNLKFGFTDYMMFFLVVVSMLFVLVFHAYSPKEIRSAELPKPEPPPFLYQEEMNRLPITISQLQDAGERNRRTAQRMSIAYDYVFCYEPSVYGNF